MKEDAVISWLLEGDPAIRWQVQRDLLAAVRATWQAERQRVATRGWGRRIIDLQDDGGTWGGGLYSPKWISTTYTLLELRDMGLAPGNRAATRGCRQILDRALGLDDDPGALRSLAGAGCTCMIGMWLALPAYFGVDDPKLEPMVDHLLAQQMADGGWNCRLRGGTGATHSSFHTTLNVLNVVREAMARNIGPVRKLRDAESHAVEMLLEHRLFRSHRTGEVIKAVFTKLSFPYRWHYDVLRGLDYIRGTRQLGDARLDDAFELLESKRLPDGRWPLEHEYRAKTHFRTERVGQASRWNTLRALRCLEARRRAVR